MNKYSLENKKRWADPEYKEKVSKKISEALKGRIPWIKGKHHSEETKAKIRKSKYHQNFGRFGIKNYNWKGDDATYGSIHGWILKNFKLPSKCEICGFKDRKLEWSNKDHKYSRKIEDWQAVCRSCHRRYDNERKN